MLNVKYATVCLLITYHWHGSWAAVSAWPSERTGTAAEVNGSPTDARLNIPVVKRSSNQAELANELPALPLPRRTFVVGSDSDREAETPAEFLAIGLFELAVPRDHENLTMKKLNESTMIWPRGLKRIMMERTFNHFDGETRKFNDGRDSTAKKGIRRDETGERRKFEIGFKSLIPVKEIAKVGQLIEAGNSSIDARNEDLMVLSRPKREVLIVNTGRIDGDGKKARKPSDNDARTKDNETNRLSNGSSSLSSGKFVEHFATNANKPIVVNSGITRFIGVARLLDSPRLHQQSRNTKPRTIVQHLRGDVNGQRRSYDDNTSSSSGKGFRESERRHAERRQSGRPLTNDRRDRRQSTNQQISNLPKTHGNPHQLRFIPSYNYYNRNPKSFGSQGTNENGIDELVVLSENGELTSRNIANLPSFNEEQIENLSKSLGGVFDRHLSIKQKMGLPNVRTILPKQVFVAPPRHIYDTKVLPAPFSLSDFLRNSGNNVDSDDNDENDEREKNNVSGLPIVGVFDRKEMNVNLDERPSIPANEDSRVSVTSSGNFVTPLPAQTNESSLGVNEQREMTLVTAFPNEMDRVRGLEKMENQSGVGVYETLQRDEDKTRVNQKSTSSTASTKVHSSNDARTNYDNSLRTYTSRDESELENVDRSNVLESVDNKYTNYRTTSFPDSTKIPSNERTRKTEMRVRQNDENYDRGGNKWRGEYDNDRARYVAKYSFGYLVNDDDTDNDFGHREMRDEGVTKGRYHVRLPDGRIQKVDYQVDENGYRAAVSYHLDKSS